MKLTDAALAAVLGHEISHALREHTRARVANRISDLQRHLPAVIPLYQAASKA